MRAVASASIGSCTILSVMARTSSIPSVERSDSGSRISSACDSAIVHPSWSNSHSANWSYAVARPLIPNTTTRETIRPSSAASVGRGAARLPGQLPTLLSHERGEQPAYVVTHAAPRLHVAETMADGDEKVVELQVPLCGRTPGHHQETLPPPLSLPAALPHAGRPQQRLVLTVLPLARGSQVLTSGLIDAVRGIERRRRRSHPVDVCPPPADGSGACWKCCGIHATVHRQTVISSVSSRTNWTSVSSRSCSPGPSRRDAPNVTSMAEYLRDVLRLWQGTAPAGMRGGCAQIQRPWLDELRLAAQAACSEAQLGLRRHVEAAADLTGLVTRHRPDERSCDLLMLALYRSGRRSAAFDTYRAAQALLADEMGTDSGPALQTMYQRVLRTDGLLLAPSAASVVASAPGRASVTPAQLLAALPVFVGRDAELARPAELSSGGAVVVSAMAGMSGVGKAVFSAHWARQVADRFPVGQLYLNLRGFDLVGSPVPPERALRTLLQPLGADTRGLPQEATGTC
ncbi:AfsR/SARP family transcriptional regulator [Streptomyces tauricus]|uniref:AfsR/SARP family transcriptional regulator n=1 Tax=Streptomyces tauricus TaxID=68274 RepID=UPI002243D665|nr:AfsR/SARP family transcriptional regulator [Streptomyces tauricus]MCW8103565.1 AfsR/SARP family transcriptional regulator [Streptomyces tauricus]